jgi:hypothetical protein
VETLLLPVLETARAVDGPRGAEADFALALSLWHAGASPDPGLLAESRRLDLKLE